MDCIYINGLKKFDTKVIAFLISIDFMTMISANKNKIKKIQFMRPSTVTVTVNISVI